MEGGKGGEEAPGTMSSDESSEAVDKRPCVDDHQLQTVSPEKRIERDTAETTTICRRSGNNELEERTEGTTAGLSINMTGAVRGGTVGTLHMAGIVINVNTPIVTIPDHLHELLEKTKKKIERDTAGMVRVSAVDDVLNKMEVQRWITITGNAGDGKTVLGYLVLKEFLLKNVGVFTVSKPKDYDQIAMMKEDKVIMFDDRFGAFLADQKLIKKWFDVIEEILKDIEGENQKLKVIFISRKNVVNESKVYLGRLNDSIFDKKCVIDLSKRKVPVERRNILEYHLGHENVTIDPETTTRVCNMEVAHGFPYCSKMFSKFKSKGYGVPIEDFFESPLKFLDMTTEVLFNDNCGDLFKLMIKNDGELNVENVEDEDKRLALLKVGKEQEGSYITVWRNGICQFAHPSVYESVLNIINDIDPLYCVQYATLSVIRQKMIISTTDEENSRAPCYIIVKPIPAVLKSLVERFREEILEGDYSVFTHRLCQSREFCEALVSGCVCDDENEKGSKQFINKRGVVGDTMMCAAAKGGRMAAVHSLVEAGADVNIERSRSGRTALHYLCRLRESVVWDYDDDDDEYYDATFYEENEDEDKDENYCVNIDTIQLIITKARGHVNIRDESGQTPLHYLCKVNSPDDQQRGVIDALRLLITEGRGDVNIRDVNGQTPLHYLCKVNSPDDQQRGVIDALRLLITEGRGDVNIRDVSGQTPLDYLCKVNSPDDQQRGVIDALRLIFTDGRGDVNIRDESGQTPLHYLCNVNSPDDQQRGVIDALRLLITEERGDVNIRDVSGQTPLDYLGNVNSPDDQQRGVIDALRLIITEGRGDVNIRDESGQTPLHYLCKVNSPDEQQRGVIDALRLFITEGRGDVNIPDRFGRTALHYLCQLNSTDDQQCVVINALRLFITEGRGDLNHPDTFGHTPLHYLFRCTAFSREEMKFIIFEGKGDLNRCGQHKSTPLHYLCAYSGLQLDTVDLVINEGKGDLNKGDEHGTTPFHYLCENGKVDFNVKLRITNTAKGDFNQQDDNGITPLHVLCKGTLQMKDVLTLIKEGDKADMYGNTPLHFLCRRGGISDEEIQQLKQLPESNMKKQNKLGFTPLDYLNDQDDSLPWTDGMIDRSAADLVLCRVKHGDASAIVLGRAMILNSQKVYGLLQVKDFGRELTNMADSGERITPGQFEKFQETCSSPLPLPPSPSPLTSPSYWETQSTLRWREWGGLLLQMGVKEGESNMDRGYCVSYLNGGVAVSVWGERLLHRSQLCIQVLRRDQEEGMDHQVGECVTLPRPTSGEEVTFTFGLVLDVGRGRVAFLDVGRGKLLCKYKLDLEFTQQVFPMFYVTPDNSLGATRMRLVSGREISVTDQKIQLIQQALSD